MMLDQTTLLLGMAVAMLFALLAALNVAAYGALAWLGWPGPAVFAHGVAERLVVAAVVVAIATFVSAALVPWGAS
jgi:hypothetical protein